MKFNNHQEDAQCIKVLVTRKAGSQFYAGPTEESPRAREASNSLGTPVSGRPEHYPLLANFPEGLEQKLRFVGADGEVVSLAVAGATCTLVIGEDDLRALNEQAGNAWLVTAHVIPSAPNTQDPGSLLYGSIWLEPVGELSATRAPGLIPDAELAAKAIEAAAARAREGREMRRATVARQSGQVKA